MPDVVDLSQYQVKGTAPAPQIDASSEADPLSPKRPVKVALVLFQDQDGAWSASPDIRIAQQIEPTGVADGQSLIAGLSVLISDIQAEKTANLTTALMQQLAQAQMQQIQAQQIAAGLNLQH